MKKASLLLIAVQLLSSVVYAEPAAVAEAFMTLTRTSLPYGDLPANTEVVTPAQIKAYNAADAGEAVNRATSVQVLPFGGTGSLQTVKIRGSSSEQTLILIDGLPVTGYELGSADLSEIPVGSIDHIEIVRGGLSALYGPNAMGGVINVITKRATGKTTADVQTRFSSYGKQELRFSAGSKFDNIDYFVYGDKQRDSGFRTNSDTRIYNVGGNVGIPFEKAGKLTFDAAAFHNEIGLPGYLVLPTNQFNNDLEKAGSTPDARQDTTRRTLKAGYTLPLPGNNLLVLKGYHTEREVKSTDPGDPLNPFHGPADGRLRTESKGVDGQVDLPFGFTVGGNFVRDREDSQDLIVPDNSFINAIEQWGVFIQQTFRWKQFTLIPSGRYDHNSHSGESKNPRVQLAVDATPWLKVSASAARSFRAPSILDLFYRFKGDAFNFPFNGNPNLRPEKAWTYDIGAEAHDESKSIRLSLFRSNITDLIQVNPITFDSSVNIGEARRQGIEIEGRQVVSEHFSHLLNYTFLENRGIPAGFTDFVTLSYSPKHTLNHTLMWMPSKAWEWDLITRFIDKRYSGNNLGGSKLGSQVTWDTRVAYKRERTEFFVGINDLFDKRYVMRDTYPLPGITFFGGVQWHFE